MSKKRFKNQNVLNGPTNLTLKLPEKKIGDIKDPSRSPNWNNITQLFSNFIVNLSKLFQTGDEFVRANCPEIVKGVEKLANLVKSLL